MTETDYQSLCSLMDGERRLCLDKIKNTGPRFLSAAAEGLVRSLLCRASGRSAGDFHIYRTEDGKPYQTLIPGLHFNLSHSGKLAACVVADREVGIDIQTLIRKPERVVRKTLCEEEAERMNGFRQEGSIYSEEGRQYMTRVWCRKESYLKCLGCGIRRELTDINTEQMLREGEYLFFEYEPEEDYFLTICMKRKVGDDIERLKELLHPGFSTYN